MTLAFHATAPSDLPAVQGFLRDVFNVSPGASFLDEAHVAWKDYSAHPHWSGSRSYVYETDGGIGAHACAWPVQLLTVDGTLTVVHPIDWAASAKIPGIGALILRRLQSLGDVAFGVGGTATARQVIAQSGFRSLNNIVFYARPLRPLRQTLTHQRRDWKLPARMARNVAWTLRFNPSIPTGWTVEHIDPEHLPESVLPAPTSQIAVTARTRQLFAYFRACPVARHELFLIRNRGKAVGYFLLSFTPGQARICDGFMSELTPQAWAGLYACAIRVALDEGSASEITAASSLDELRDALDGCGFRQYRALPIMFFDGGNRLSSIRRIHLQMIDNDFSFLHEDRPEYRT